MEINIQVFFLSFYMRTYLGINFIKTKSRLFILSSVLRRLSLCEQTFVPQRMSCSGKQRFVPPRYCFSWPSSKAMLNHPKLGHPSICSSPAFVLSTPQWLPTTCSNRRAAAAVSAAALCLAVNWELYLCGFYVMVCMKGTLRPLEVCCEKQEERKHMPEYLTAM